MDKKKKLLVVEDSLELQNLNREIFESEGYDVDCVSNGEEALSWLRMPENQPDLILLDLMMPVMDGFEFRKRQLADHRIRSIPIIVMTAAADIDAKGKQLGAKDTISKSTDLDELIAIVKRNIV
jgi:CheY-like chemotaxis protein